MFNSWVHVWHSYNDRATSSRWSKRTRDKQIQYNKCMKVTMQKEKKDRMNSLPNKCIIFRRWLHTHYMKQMNFFLMLICFVHIIEKKRKEVYQMIQMCLRLLSGIDFLINYEIIHINTEQFIRPYTSYYRFHFFFSSLSNHTYAISWLNWDIS
jgi:hypothetical protein